MKPEEFVFAIPRWEDHFLNADDLKAMDDIIIKEFRELDERMKNNYCYIFKQVPVKYDSEPKLIPQGKMKVEDAIKKFS